MHGVEEVSVTGNEERRRERLLLRQASKVERDQRVDSLLEVDRPESQPELIRIEPVLLEAPLQRV